jgi:PEP-CTERM motif
MKLNPAAGAFLIAACCTATATAEPIRILSGAIRLDSEGSLNWQLEGSRFAVARDINPDFFWDTTGLDIGCFNEGGCANGERMAFSTATFDNRSLGRGDALVNGVAYDDIDFSGSWSLSSPGAALPDGPELFAVLVAPFSFSGSLRGARDGQEIFNVDLIGSGRAQVSIARIGPGGWVIDEAASLDYLFATPTPVPEPASMLLVATGCAAFAAARRRGSWSRRITSRAKRLAGPIER